MPLYPIYQFIPIYHYTILPNAKIPNAKIPNAKIPNDKIPNAKIPNAKIFETG